MENQHIQKKTEERCVQLLLEKHLTITTAESCTGGMVASRIVNVPGASEVLMQGLVTYSNEAKERYLGVKHETLREFGPVSAETAGEMAFGAVRTAGTDVGIATTGLAGPGGGSPEKPVGLVYIACCIGEKVCVKKLNLSGSREEIRSKAADEALALLYTELSERQNTWYTQIRIKAERAEIEKLSREFEKATETEHVSGHGKKWLGNLALHIGHSEDALTTKEPECSGVITNMYRESPTVYVLNTFSDGCPSVQCVKKFVDAFVEDAWVTYTAQDNLSGQRFQRYWTNDPDAAGTVDIDWFDELPEWLEDMLLRLQGTKREYVESELSKYLGQMGTLEGLGQIMEDRCDRTIFFHTYRYVRISQTSQGKEKG